MKSPQFVNLYKNLNTAQKKAVDNVEGAVMVVAGPGTGKTQVLTLRIANILLKTQVNPENILALTFTEAAAYEMRKRLMSVIGHDAYRVDITTFHSFCNNFIRRHQEEFENIIASESINEIEQFQIIEKCMKNLKLEILRPLGDISYYIKPVLSQINELKRENITPKLFEKALFEQEKELSGSSDLYHEKGAHKGKMKSIYQKAFKDIAKNKELLAVYKAYQEKMKSERKYDYNDMLLQVIDKLQKNPYLLQILQEKYQYFLVDEHQDTNASQNKIVELMCNYFENPNLFVVGDEKQAIFRFQGATLENFLYFKTLYPKAVLINLSENYRSTQTILDATHAVILNNPTSALLLSEKIGLSKNVKHKEEKIGVAVLSSSDIEYLWVAEKIKELLKATPAHEIAILARNNRELYPFISILDNEKIPYVVESDSNVLDDIEIQKLMIILKTIDIKARDEFVARALFLDCFKIFPLDVFKLTRKRYENKVTMWEILQNEEVKKELNLKSEDEIDRFVKLFTDRTSGFIKASQNERFDKVFVDVLNKSGLMEEILKKKHAQEILSRIVRLYDEIKEQVGRNASFSLSDFLQYIELLEKHGIALKQNTRIIPDGVVRIMTVHKAKGLEFDFVFLINVYDSHWGNQRKRGVAFRIPWGNLSLRLNKTIPDNENSDERRLFYVALTRARKKIFLSYSTSSEDGTEQIPSQFIQEIPENLKTQLDTSGFEKDLLSHREKLFRTDKKNNSVKELKFSKEYVKDLFIKQGLSVSALNNYLECPWKFFFVNLIRIPEKIDDAGLFGNAIHGAIDRFIISRKKGNPTSLKLLNYFKEELAMQPITFSERERFEKRGLDALTSFYENRLKYLSKDAQSETEIRGIRINDNLILNGKIDMIEPDGPNYFMVTDFKTGKAKSRNQIEGLTKGSDGNYKRQLVFYKILLNNYRNGLLKMKNGIIEFVEPAESGEHKREIFEIKDDEVNTLLLQTKNVAEEIINLKFWDSTCGKTDCEYCYLREYITG